MQLNNNQQHSFHLVNPSPWPILTGFSALILTVGFVLYMHGYSRGNFLFNLGFFLILCLMFFWWRDVIREATFEGQHTKSVQSGLKLGVLLFITSEIMFFLAFFWAFFHFSINPSIFIGGVWPPAFLTILNPWKIPLLNTIILLSSGATITLAHHSIVWGSKEFSLNALVATIILALFFTFLQALEYYNSPFSINSSVYGSSFFMLTGFHGFHVLIGTCFIFICSLRLYFNHLTREHHFGFEAAAWYWHFVDVVWLFLFITVYWWGS
jgi:cytochrome c oxidase subunit 3